MSANHKPLPSRKRLLKLFAYDPATGNLYHRREHARVQAGDKAGCLMSKGYISVRVDGVGYLAHRIIFRLCTGIDAGDFTIDHRNHIRNDNRICNLRLATARQQQANGADVTGCHYCGARKAWQAQIKIDGAPKHLGLWPTKEIARAVYATAAAEVHGEFAPAAPPNPFGFTNTHWGKCSDGSAIGVGFHKPTGKWCARITIDGKQKHLGLFATQQEAREVRRAAEAELCLA